MGKLLLVDGSALLHRAYHAYPSLTTKTGEVVGAVYGVVSMLISALEAEQPEKVVVAWDLPKPTFRHEKYIGYKAQRAKADEEMVEQIPTVKELVGVMGLLQLEKEGYEADDIIGTLAEESDGEVVILSGDMDLTQLVTKRVKLLTPPRGRVPAKLYGPEEVESKFGVGPEQIVDYKAMVGDSSDNIPGVRGVGPKGAAQLLQEYGSLEKIYENLPRIKETMRRKLEEGRESAWLSRELSEIERGVKLGYDEEGASYEGLEREEFRERLVELGFRSLVRRVFGVVEERNSKVDERQGELF